MNPNYKDIKCKEIYLAFIQCKTFFKVTKQNKKTFVNKNMMSVNVCMKVLY